MNLNMMHSAQEIVDAIGSEIAKQTETMILEQLSELLKAGVLVVESTQPVMLLRREFSGETSLVMSEAARLTFRGAEELAKLREENEELRAKMRVLKSLFQDAA